MRRGIVIFAWMLAAAGGGLAAGTTLFGLSGVFISAPGLGADPWPGWNLLFLALFVCLPVALAILALLLGFAGRLPGTRRT